jgi:mutator protein MutT
MQPKHIVAITALIKNKTGDKFLLIKRKPNEIAFGGKWVFPGGKAEREESILTTLKREVLEEVGLKIEDDKQYLKDFTFIRPDGHNVIGLCFLVQAKSEDITLHQDFTNFCWITPQELANYDHINGMEEEVQKAFREYK